ncbi:radical SAM protein [Mariprofundus erugo]|nr:radical SAM protein [Mariprofundus erugo]
MDAYAAGWTKYAVMPLHYHMPLYRPPAEADNLVIQATLGCSFNRCSFCAMYRDKPYSQRSLEAVINDIQQAARIRPETRRVFLADGDALSLPTPQLLAILDALHVWLPGLARVSCYATPANILNKSPQHLRWLKERGLRLFYLGIESGSALMLRKTSKGASPEGIARAIQAASAAGIRVSATVILGLGGQQYWQEHIDATIALLNEAPVHYLSTLQLYVDPAIAGEFYQKFGEPFLCQDDQGMLREQARLIAGLNRPLIFRSDHASNAFPLAGNLPRDREKLLAELKRAMRGEQQLRPWYLRGM